MSPPLDDSDLLGPATLPRTAPGRVGERWRRPDPLSSPSSPTWSCYQIFSTPASPMVLSVRNSSLPASPSPMSPVRVGPRPATASGRYAHSLSQTWCRAASPRPESAVDLESRTSSSVSLDVNLPWRQGDLARLSELEPWTEYENGAGVPGAVPTGAYPGLADLSMSIEPDVPGAVPTDAAQPDLADLVSVEPDVEPEVQDVAEAADAAAHDRGFLALPHPPREAPAPGSPTVAERTQAWTEHELQKDSVRASDDLRSEASSQSILPRSIRTPPGFGFPAVAERFARSFGNAWRRASDHLEASRARALLGSPSSQRPRTRRASVPSREPESRYRVPSPEPASRQARARRASEPWAAASWGFHDGLPPPPRQPPPVHDGPPPPPRRPPLPTGPRGGRVAPSRGGSA